MSWLLDDVQVKLCLVDRKIKIHRKVYTDQLSRLDKNERLQASKEMQAQAGRLIN